MDKKQALEQIKILIRNVPLSREDLLDTYETTIQTDVASMEPQQSRMSAILYFIGGIIVFLGICILVGQQWSDLNNTSKILVTLGCAIASYVIGILFSYYGSLTILSQAFYFISGLLAPLGLQVTFDIAGFKMHDPGVQSLIASILFSIYVISYALQRKEVFLIFSIIFGTWFYYVLLEYMTQGIMPHWQDYAYRSLALSIVYLILGYYYQNQEKAVFVTLSNWLYAFGLLGFLGTTLALGEWKPSQNVFWELSYPLWVFGTLYLSVYLKQRVFLTFGTLFMMAYIMKITSEYFTQGLGWPMALIIAGLGVMGTGYLAFYLNKKYVSNG